METVTKFNSLCLWLNQNVFDDSCVGSAAGSFSAAVGKMYVLKHFDHEAKETMLEMVGDIREEFKNILDEVCGQTRQIIQYIAIERDTYTSASKKKIFANLMVSFFGFSYWKIDWPRLGHYFFCQGTGRFLNLLFRMWTGFMQGLDWAGQYQEDFRKAKKISMTASFENQRRIELPTQI